MQEKARHGVCTELEVVAKVLAEAVEEGGQHLRLDGQLRLLLRHRQIVSLGAQM